MAKRFSHWLIRTVGYEAMLHSQRRVIHGATAAAVEEESYGRGAPSEEQLSSALSEESRTVTTVDSRRADLGAHWERSAGTGTTEDDRVRRRAGLHLAHAAREAETRCEYVLAASLGQRARKLVAQSGSDADAARCGATHARALRRLAQHDEAERICEEALAIARRIADGPLQAGCLHGLGVVQLNRGNVSAAEQRYGEALAVARSVGSPAWQAYCLESLGGIRAERGDLDEAERLTVESLSIAERTGDGRTQAFALRGLAELHTARGSLVEAGRLFGAALAMAEKIGDQRLQAFCLHGLGTVSAERGELDDGEALLVRSLSLARRIGEQRLQAICLYGLGELSIDRGTAEAAVRSYEASLVISRRVRDSRLEAHALGGLGKAQMELGRYDEAARTLSEAVDGFEKVGIKGERAAALACRAEVNLRSEKRALAIDDATRALVLAEETQEVDARSAALRVQGLVRGDEAFVTLALEAARRAGRVGDECRALLACAEVRTALRNETGARLAAQDAAEIARRSRMNGMLRRAEALIADPTAAMTEDERAARS